MSEPPNPELAFLTGVSANPFGTGFALRGTIELGENSPNTQLAVGFAWDLSFSASEYYDCRAIRTVPALAGASAGLYLMDNAGHKSEYISTNSSGTALINLQGNNDGWQLRPILSMPGCNINDTWLEPNDDDTVRVPHNSVGMLEMHLKWNTEDNFDGFLDGYLNGVRTHHYTGIQFNATPDVWINAKHDPYMNNAQTPSVTEPQWFDLFGWLTALAA